MQGVIVKVLPFKDLPNTAGNVASILNVLMVKNT